MRIVHLPLDSRPCNVLFPVQFAQWCGHGCIIPQMGDMDHFTAPASFEASRSFLLREAQTADALVVSVEHLCFGSLLESRNEHVSQAEALRRLSLLEEIHLQHPTIPIYAYSVVMRSSVSALAAGDLAIHRAVTSYSMYSDLFAQSGDPADLRCAQEARALIPAHVLNRYETARARNHAVNRRCVELAATGVLHSLSLLQEDSETSGFHKAEQRALIGLCTELNAVNVRLRNGTDEGGALMVMTAIAAAAALPPVAVRYLGWDDGAFVARYEDRPFRENVEDSLACAGLRIDPGARDVLAVCCPPDGKQTDWITPAYEPAFEEMADELVRLCREGKNVYLLDVTRANGGAPGLLRAVYRLLPELTLAGYSAWNTASNSLGTAIAQMISDMLANQPNVSFLWERIIDDLAYQGMAREKLNNLLEARGEDLLHLHDLPAAEKVLRALMDETIRTEPMFSQAPGFSIRLPWGRTFEAEVRTLNRP